MCSLVKGHILSQGVTELYQALYRKWRPKTFDEVIGQEHITETLKTQVQTGHLSHAYIFIGTRGTGKTTCARILAKAVNCENPINGNPCNKCRYCRGIDDGSILDIVELDAASNTGVDNVRDLREEAVFSPALAKKRVYIIDEVHMLSLAAFNALLKIIEEPPPHLMFILATTELQKVPATILSRCQRHSFRRIPTERLARYLQQIADRESILLNEDAALQIGRLAEGGVRDALSILDQCSGRGDVTTETVFETMGLAGNRNLVQILKMILRHDCSGALKLFQKIWLDGKEPSVFLGELNGLIRDVLIVKAAPAGAEELISGNYERNVLDAFALRMTKEEILFCADTIQEAAARIRQVKSPRVIAELCIVSLCDAGTVESAISLRARISRLEEAVRCGRVVSAEPGIEDDRTEEAETYEPVDTSAPSWPEEDAGQEPEDEELSPAPVQEPEADDAFQPQPELEESIIRNETGVRQNAKVLQEDIEADSTDSGTEAGDHAGQVKKILEIAKEKLPMDVRFSLDDPDKMSVRLDHRDLVMEAVPGFILERLKKPENRAIFAAAAETVLGHPAAIRISELNRDTHKTRDINELRQFKEVTFLS